MNFLWKVQGFIKQEVHRADGKDDEIVSAFNIFLTESCCRMFVFVLISFHRLLFQYYPFGFDQPAPAAAAPAAPAAPVAPAAPAAPVAPVAPVVIIAAPVRAI